MMVVMGKKRQEAGCWKAAEDKMLRFRTRRRKVGNMRDEEHQVLWRQKPVRARLRSFGRRSESE